jgi:hypothetical protein
MVAQYDASATWDRSPSGFLYPRARAVVGYQITDWFALDAGVSVRALVPSLSSSLSGYDPSHVIFQPVLIAGVHLG